MRTFYLSPARFFNTMLGNLGQIVIANWDDFSDIIPIILLEPKIGKFL